MTADNKKPSLEDMKAELEAEEYSVDYIGNQLMIEWSVEYDDNGVLVMRYIDANFDDSNHYERFIRHAYRHLQERRELEDLRAFVLNIDGFDALISIEEIGNRYDEMRGEAHRLISQFNITTDNDSLSHDDIADLREGNNQRIVDEESDGT